MKGLFANLTSIWIQLFELLVHVLGHTSPVIQLFWRDCIDCSILTYTRVYTIIVCFIRDRVFVSGIAPLIEMDRLSYMYTNTWE